jgi:hypothetical protein
MAANNKYAALTDWLQQCDKDAIKLTFDELSEIITIPPSAYRDRQSWANCTTQNSTSFQRSWLNAGYRVTGISLQEQWVEFTKGEVTVSPSRQIPMHSRTPTVSLSRQTPLHSRLLLHRVVSAQTAMHQIQVLSANSAVHPEQTEKSLIKI